MSSRALLRRWLTPAGLTGGLWLCLATLAVVVFAAGMGVWFERLQTVCLDTAQACQAQLRVSAANAQALQDTGWSLTNYAWYSLGTRVLAKLLGLAIGVLVFWRRPASRMALVASLFLIIGLEGSVYTVLTMAAPAWTLPARVVAFTGILCFGLFFYLFPSGEFMPRWARWAALAWAAVFGLDSFFPGSALSISQWPIPVTFGVVLLFFGSFVMAQIRRYRAASGPAERLQTRWVVFATAVSVLIFVATVIALAGRDERFSRWWVLADLGFTQVSVLVPAAIGVSILRYRLWDIDVIIRRTLVYSVLTAALALAYFGSVLVLESAFRAVTGQGQSALVVVLSTLAIAALFGPLRRRVQRAIDRRFYRQKYNAARILAEFGANARDETDLERLSAELVGVVNDTMQPAHVGLWLRPTRGPRP